MAFSFYYRFWTSLNAPAQVACYATMKLPTSTKTQMRTREEAHIVLRFLLFYVLVNTAVIKRLLCHVAKEYMH